MPDRAIDVAPTGSTPWAGMTSCFRFGDLSGVLDLSGEHGFAAGLNLSDADQPNIVGTNSQVRIQFKGDSFGCLTFDAYDNTGIHASAVHSLDFTVRGDLFASFDADYGLIIYDNDGQQSLRLARRGSTLPESVDIFGYNGLVLSSDTSVHVIVDAGNSYTDQSFFVSKNAEGSGSASDIFYVGEELVFGILGASSYHQATGLVKFSNSFFEVSQADSTHGGASIYGIRDYDASGGCDAMKIYGLVANNFDTTNSISGRGAIELCAGQLSSGSLADVIANGNLVVIRTRDNGVWETKWLVDNEGDVKRDGGISTFDEEDDARAISDLYHVLCGEHESVIRYDAERLEGMGAIAGLKRPLISEKVTTALMFGSIRQLRDRLDRVAEGLQKLEAQVGI